MGRLIVFVLWPKRLKNRKIADRRGSGSRREARREIPRPPPSPLRALRGFLNLSSHLYGERTAWVGKGAPGGGPLGGRCLLCCNVRRRQKGPVHSRSTPRGFEGSGKAAAPGWMPGFSPPLVGRPRGGAYSRVSLPPTGGARPEGARNPPPGRYRAYSWDNHLPLLPVGGLIVKRKNGSAARVRLARACRGPPKWIWARPTPKHPLSRPSSCF
jgi:hypothetical protein